MFNFKKLLAKILSAPEEKETKSNIIREDAEMESPIKSIYFAGTCITVVLDKDRVLMTGEGDLALYEKLKLAKTELEVLALMKPKHVPSIDKKIAMEDVQDKQIIQKIVESPSLPDCMIAMGGEVYFEDVKIPMPGVIAAALKEAWGTPRYEPLKKFWYRLALNPLEQCRNDIYNFIRKNNVKITDNGLMVLYRRIVSVENKVDKTLLEYVSSQYAKVKISKKSPKNYSVCDMGESSFICPPIGKEKGKTIGNLKDLYNNLKDREENTYTAAQDKTMKIRIGDVYRIPEDQINLDNSICAAGGLHAAARSYNYTGFGDVPVMVLVNPSKAITVPRGETGKLRTTEMFIACKLEIKNGAYMDDKVDIVAFDEEYAAITMEELEQAVKNQSLKPATIKGKVEVKEISQLELIKNQLKQRIQKI